MEDIYVLSAKIISRLENLLWEQKFASDLSLSKFETNTDTTHEVQDNSSLISSIEYQTLRTQNDFSIENEILSRENGRRT